MQGENVSWKINKETRMPARDKAGMRLLATNRSSHDIIIFQTGQNYVTLALTA